MIWVGDRLWVAVANRVFASDISNPFSFRETVYLGGSTGFEFPGEVTAMATTPSIEFPQLLVYTAHDATLIQADIRDRSAWPNTDGFQREVFQVGAVGQRSVIAHYGQLGWFSKSGVVFLDAAEASKISAKLPLRDSEMAHAKVLLSEDLSLTAGAAFGPYMLFSLPAEDQFNKHTWVLNGASFQTLHDDSGPSWAGYWIGTRPVEWVYGEIAGAERIYHVSTDSDGENRLWETFLKDRLDNGCPITWAFETRGYFGVTSQKKIAGDNCRMAWADVSFVGIEEDLDVGIFYAGGLRGAYKSILAKRISVERGSLESGQEVTADSDIFAFKPQARVLRTQDANQTPDVETGSCPVESPDNENIDESFQLLVVCHGPGAVRQIRTFAFTTPPDLSGNPKACEPETPFNVIRFDGSGTKDSDYSSALEKISSKELSRFTSNKTATVSQSGFSAVGVGYAESIISKAAADRVAEIIATKAAEAELNAFLPPVLSLGEGFDA